MNLTLPMASSSDAGGGQSARMDREDGVRAGQDVLGWSVGCMTATRSFCVRVMHQSLLFLPIEPSTKVFPPS